MKHSILDSKPFVTFYKTEKFNIDISFEAYKYHLQLRPFLTSYIKLSEDYNISIIVATYIAGCMMLKMCML